MNRLRIVLDLERPDSWGVREMEAAREEVVLYAKALIPSAARQIKEAEDPQVSCHVHESFDGSPCYDCQLLAIDEKN